jgi:sarcosine oxidase
VIGHDRGASQDHSRIIRLSYHTPHYVDLAKQAYASWTQLADESDENFVLRTGGLDLWPANAAIPMSDYVTSLTACGVDHEILDAQEMARRWPQFTLKSDVVGLWQSEGGIVAAARANKAHIQLARARGATLMENARVTSIEVTENWVELAGQNFRLRCRKLVIAADAWTNDLLANLGLQLPLTITQEQVTYFVPTAIDAFDPAVFPVWIWMDDPSFYGFPIFGEPAVKVGQDVGGRRVTPATRDFETDEAALSRVVSFLDTNLPAARGRALYTKSCLYTMPPDRDFIVDTLPGHPDIILLQGAAHAFKYASLLGRVASSIALDESPGIDLTPFRFDRPALAGHHAPESFLI